jgi:curved DNA-binding protein CbpA
MKVTKSQLKQILKEEIENYYRLLEVPPDGKPTDNVNSIKKAFIAKAKQVGSNEAEREKLQQIYGTLLDPEEKQKYDKKLYDDAVAFKQQKPNAKFNGNNGLPLDDETIAKLKDMSENPGSPSQRAAAAKTDRFDRETGLPLNAEAMGMMIKNQPERVREEILPKIQELVNNIKDTYGLPVASMVVAAYKIGDNKAEILFNLLQASQKLEGK